MAPTKLLNLIAISSLAILACSFGASPVNALTVDTSHFARSPARGHALLAKKKRGSNPKRCKPRPASSTPVVSKPVATAPQSSKAPVKTQTPPPPPPPSSGGAPNNGGGNSGSNGGNGKVGLAWPIDDDVALANFKTDKVGPIYTWSPWIPQKARDLGFEPVVMLWGDKQIGEFTQKVKKGYARTVLGFNEPDQSGQANMSPQHAADVWKKYIQPLKNEGYSLISPACTSAPHSKKWMQDFFAACNGCTFDGVATHWYGTDPKELINYITDFHNTFGRPIWLTEFACQNFSGGAQCNSDQVWNFMKVVTDFMNGADWVAHYFAFGAMTNMSGVNDLNRLLGYDHKPTALGYEYIN